MASRAFLSFLWDMRTLSRGWFVLKERIVLLIVFKLVLLSDWISLNRLKNILLWTGMRFNMFHFFRFGLLTPLVFLSGHFAANSSAHLGKEPRFHFSQSCLGLQSMGTGDKYFIVLPSLVFCYHVQHCFVKSCKLKWFS